MAPACTRGFISVRFLAQWAPLGSTCSQDPAGPLPSPHFRKTLVWFRQGKKKEWSTPFTPKPWSFNVSFVLLIYLCSQKRWDCWVWWEKASCEFMFFLWEMEVYFYTGITVWWGEDAGVEMEGNVQTLTLEVGSFGIWEQLRFIQVLLFTCFGEWKRRLWNLNLKSF